MERERAKKVGGDLADKGARFLPGIRTARTFNPIKPSPFFPDLDTELLFKDSEHTAIDSPNSSKSIGTLAEFSRFCTSG